MRFRAWPSVLLLAGCVDCHIDDTPIQVYDGCVSEDQTFYMSQRWEGPLLIFPGGRRYVFYHGLSRAPETIDAYLSFRELSFGDSDSESSISESAGNQAVIECVTDQYIVVRNDTCANFYLRVVAELGPSSGVTPDGWSTGAECEKKFPDLPTQGQPTGCNCGGCP